MLQVRNGQIVNSRNEPVQLRGTCIGGWMHMENFINGYPGAEHALKETMQDMLGPARTEFFFERLLAHFFTEEDVAFIRSTGANTVRIALNYRQFERDDRPFKYLEAGFTRLERALEWCAKHEIYAILDLHAVQGWQNTDWHSDNANRMSLFWQHPHFQDRFVQLWEALAERFRDHSWVAGYNVMNEPVTNAPRGRFGSNAYTPNWEIINRVYRRVVSAIRQIDPQHIIFLEGDLFSTRFAGLDAPFDENLVYSSHNYTPAGFGPGIYPGEFQGSLGSFQNPLGQRYWDRERQREMFFETEGARFAQQHGVPLWVGEFGSVYNGPGDDIPSRLRAMDDQISVFEEFGAHWTTWNYKDVGVMGLVTLDPQSPYLRLVAPSLRAKAELDTDFWMGWLPSTSAKEKLTELARIIEATVNDPNIEPAANRRFLGQATFDHYVGGLLQPSYVRLFQGLSENELDEVLSSFAFRNCRPNVALARILGTYTQQPQTA
ncbi:glycoside hydrolase family 5 protein [Deinococcus sp. YIM 77859]|uniref:glycoside hydrolase family 5 protein n=1 Tax=Deinococcus sp. YIM 77859 TaxID=1540221 RepID=UPI000552EC50|nr:cellulase family glycosylhydrolase [Deinococcus sp. YIM 77859]